MFKDEIQAVANAAAGKYNLLKNKKFAFFISAMLAGAFIGFGSIMTGVMGGLLSANFPSAARVANSIVFTIALSMVVMCGAELFTGNNFVMAVGLGQKKVTFKQVLGVWVIGYIANYCGAMVLSLLYKASGAATEPMQQAFANMASAKMNMLPHQMLVRGILCNMLVCLAVWCSIKLKNEVAKLIMIVMCIFTFMIIGLEHSVANMTTLSLGLFFPHDATVTLGGYGLNLLMVTIGNMIGGFIVAGAYYAIGGSKQGE